MTSAIESTLDSYRQALRSEGLVVRPGVSVAQRHQFETDHDVVLPDEMRHFYESTDGMAPDEYAFESFVRVWQTAELTRVQDEFPGDEPARAFLIADHSIAVHFYAIDFLSQENPVYLVAATPIRVATGFADFLAKVVGDSDELFRGEVA